LYIAPISVFPDLYVLHGLALHDPLELCASLRLRKGGVLGAKGQLLDAAGICIALAEFHWTERNSNPFFGNFEPITAEIFFFSARSKQPWHHSTTHGVADSA